MEGSVETNLEKFNELVAYDGILPLIARIELLTSTPGEPNCIFTLTLEDFQNGRVTLTRVDDDAQEGYVVRSSGTQLFCQSSNYKYVYAWQQRHNLLLYT